MLSTVEPEDQLLVGGYLSLGCSLVEQALISPALIYIRSLGGVCFA